MSHKIASLTHGMHGRYHQLIHKECRLTVGMGGRLWLWWGRQAMMGPFVSFAPSSSDSLAFGQDQTNSCGKNVDRDTVGRAV